MENNRYIQFEIFECHLVIFYMSHLPKIVYDICQLKTVEILFTSFIFLNKMMSYNIRILSNMPEIPKSTLINSMIKGPTSRRNFTREEDARLTYLVHIFGSKNWTLIAEMMPMRNARQCKDRFTNYLSPMINLKPWSPEEDSLLIQKVKECGPKWVQISRFFEGRSDNNLKNRWYTHLKTKCENEEKIYFSNEISTMKNENNQSSFNIFDLDTEYVWADQLINACFDE